MSEIIDKPDSYQAFLLDDATKSKWYRIVFDLKKQFGKKPDMNGILFLIGMRELGQLREFAKDEKMDLINGKIYGYISQVLRPRRA